jgi:hypothetical protein
MFAYTYGVCYFWHILKITKEALIWILLIATEKNLCIYFSKKMIWAIFS